MIMVKAACLCLALGMTPVALGQTAADLGSRYKRVTLYEVAPHVVMAPSYAADGRVCRMVLEKREREGGRTVFDVSFTFKEVKHLIDELVPRQERGRDLTSPLNITIAGDFATTEYLYENIDVHVYGFIRPSPGGNRVIVITWPKRACSEPSGAKQPDLHSLSR